MTLVPEWGDDEYDDDLPEPDPDGLTVDITDPIVVGVLLGPDGEPLRYQLDRPTVPFGFQRPASPEDPPAPVTVQP